MNKGIKLAEQTEERWKTVEHLNNCRQNHRKKIGHSNYRATTFGKNMKKEQHSGWGQTALHAAAAFGHAVPVEQLLSARASLEAKTNDGHELRGKPRCFWIGTIQNSELIEPKKYI